MRQSRNDIERFIDSKLAGVRTLQALSALQTHIDENLETLYAQKRSNKDQRANHVLGKELKKWYLLKTRVDIVAPVFIDRALEDHLYLSLPEHERVDIVRYRYLCSFRLDPLELKRIKGYHLLVKHGWYNAKTNPGGVVRDHRFSIKMGWQLKVDPQIMGHPANCEFLLNVDNIRKSDSCSVTLEQLMFSING